MRQILAELAVDRLLRIIRADPSDITETSGYRAAFWNDFDHTVEEFAGISVSDRANIRRLLEFLKNTTPESFARLRRKTFQEVLDEFISSAALKAVLSLPFLGIVGLPPSMLSAFIGAKLYSEFLLDGGYYPVGGMQALPEALAERFRVAGGELRLSTAASRIVVNNHAVSGVTLSSGEVLSARFVIADCDARQTYFELVGRHLIDTDLVRQLEDLVPSPSNYILYLGLRAGFASAYPPGTFVLSSSDQDAEKAFRLALEGDPTKVAAHAFRISHDRSTVTILLQAPFLSGTDWEQRRRAFMESLITRVEQSALPRLSDFIDYRGDATPWTLYRYTRSFQGASFGWAGTPSQLALPSLRKPSTVRGLYLTGHWTTLGAGISGVAHLGAETAKMVLREAGS